MRQFGASGTDGLNKVGEKYDKLLGKLVGPDFFYSNNLHNFEPMIRHAL